MGSTMQNIIFLWSGQPLKVAILITELFCNTSGANLAGIPTKVLPNPLTLVSDQDRIPLSNINIKQTSDENTEKYQLGDYRLIQYQILQTNITRTVWQTVRRITNKILGVHGFSISPPS